MAVRPKSPIAGGDRALFFQFGVGVCYEFERTDATCGKFLSC